MAVSDESKYYTVEEAKAHVRGLTDVEWVRLNELARIRVRAVPDRTSEDFLQEAFLRVLQGDRRWPRGLSPDRFFAQILRSLVSDYWKGRYREKQRLDVRLATEVEIGDPDDDPVDVIEQHPDMAPTPEEVRYAAKTLEEFLGDLGAHARDVVEWQLAGYTKVEIQADFGLDDTAYDTITRRIRRSLAKLTVEE